MAFDFSSFLQNIFYGNGLPAFASTPMTNALLNRETPNASSIHGTTGSSSGIGSKGSDTHSYDPTPNASSFAPRQANSTTKVLDSRPPKPEKRLSAVATLAAKSLNLAKGGDIGNSSSNLVTPFTRRSESFMLRTASEDAADGSKFEVTEQSLLRDILYVFQGIEGRMIHYDEETEGYRIDPMIGVPFPIRDFIDKLNELGWLYRKVRKFLDARMGDKALGLVGQSFCSAIHRELTEYYRLLAILEAQQNQLYGNKEMEGLTLRRLMVWTNDPLVRMKALATLVDTCKGLFLA